jgi:hypothetical protein
MIKIMLIPSSKQKSADELIIIFLRIYDVLNKHFTGQFGEERLRTLYQNHIETPFLLTQYKVKAIQLRAFLWLESVILATPIHILADCKRKIIKSIFTHALFLAINDQTSKNDSLKLNAIRISAKLYKAVKLKKKHEYEELILNHLLKLMMEDEKDSVRKECITQIDLNEKTIPYVVMRSLDRSAKVRVEVYRVLKSSTRIGFLQLDIADRTHLILNGLNDYEQEVRDACREYIIHSVCINKDAVK